jgi:glycosyltransferase involved in cell wall biosynthesis
MRIAFFAHTIPFNDRTIEQDPIGGTETGVIRLCRALRDIGHDVVVFTSDTNPPLSDPLYVPVSALEDLGSVDIFIGIRDWNHLFLPVAAKVRLLWTGDSSLQPFTRGLGDKQVVDQIDGLLTVSEWHTHNLCDASGFPRSKAWVLGNGIEPSFFQGEEPRGRKRLIYSSVPYRGLQLMPEILPRLIEAHPDLEFHSFSGFRVYQDHASEDDRKQFEKVLSRLKGFSQFHDHGNVSQRELAREMMRSAILCYPNTFEETSCITALEAQAAGCAIVSSARGALPETIGDAGILVGGEPGSPEYVERFVAAVLTLLSDDAALDRCVAAGRDQIARHSWATIATRFSEYLEGLLDSKGA